MNKIKMVATPGGKSHTPDCPVVWADISGVGSKRYEPLPPDATRSVCKVCGGP